MRVKLDALHVARTDLMLYHLRAFGPVTNDFVAGKVAWTAEDHEVLRANYGKMPIGDLACKLNRSNCSVRMQAHVMGITRARTLWTKKEDEALQKGLAAQKRWKQIWIDVNEVSPIRRAQESVEQRARNLKLKPFGDTSLAGPYEKLNQHRFRRQAALSRPRLPTSSS